jgi:hypothetical protein
VELKISHQSQLNNPIVIKLDSIVIINTTLQGWIDNNTKFKIKVPRLLDKNYDRHDIYFNDVYYSKFTFKRAETLGFLEAENETVEYTYFDIYGHELKSPVNGFYIYRTNKGETGKIFIP